MMLYQGEQEGVQEHAYGRLINIMEHHLFEDGPVLVFAEFEWYTCVRKMFSGRVQIVKANPRDRWNLDSTGYRFDVFSEIVPQHVTYEPLDGHVGNQGGELMAILPWGPVAFQPSRCLAFSLIERLRSQIETVFVNWTLSASSFFKSGHLKTIKFLFPSETILF
jgi:hypothetical protein